MSVSVESCVQAFIQACLESWNIRAWKVVKQVSCFMGKKTRFRMSVIRLTSAKWCQKKHWLEMCGEGGERGAGSTVARQAIYDP